MKWISVKKELPPYNRMVLLATKRTPFCRFGRWLSERKLVEVGKRTHSDHFEHYEYIDGGMSYDLSDDKVTHWMPLPEPPK